jgi:hypothetical protein
MRFVKSHNTPSKGEVVKFKHEGAIKSVAGDGEHSCLELIEEKAVEPIVLEEAPEEAEGLLSRFAPKRKSRKKKK